MQREPLWIRKDGKWRSVRVVVSLKVLVEEIHHILFTIGGRHACTQEVAEPSGPFVLVVNKGHFPEAWERV